MTPVFVSSSNLDAIGYDRGDLVIRFHHGGCYRYKRCPYDYFLALQKAESAGQFFHKNIRGKLEFEKLDHDPFLPLKLVA